MLGMKTYTQDYVDACRARVEADLRAYRKQVGKAPSKEFEVRFFNDQVLLLDHMFVHRLTGIEGEGRQSVERGPRPVQLDPAQPGQAAGRQAQRVAELCRRFDQAPAGEVCAEAQGGRRGQTERSRLRAALQGLLRGD